MTLDLVKTAVTRLSCHYPNSGMSPKAMDIVAEDWCADFNAARITPEKFARMVILSRRRSKFFPSLADMLEFSREISEVDRRAKDLLFSLPEPELTDAQKEKDREIAEKAHSIIFLDVSPEEKGRLMAEYLEAL